MGRASPNPEALILELIGMRRLRELVCLGHLHLFSRLFNEDRGTSCGIERKDDGEKKGDADTDADG